MVQRKVGSQERSQCGKVCQKTPPVNVTVVADSDIPCSEICAFEDDDIVEEIEVPPSNKEQEEINTQSDYDEIVEEIQSPELGEDVEVTECVINTSNIQEFVEKSYLRMDEELVIETQSVTHNGEDICSIQCEDRSITNVPDEVIWDGILKRLENSTTFTDLQATVEELIQGGLPPKK